MAAAVSNDLADFRLAYRFPISTSDGKSDAVPCRSWRWQLAQFARYSSRPARHVPVLSAAPPDAQSLILFTYSRPDEGSKAAPPHSAAPSKPERRSCLRNEVSKLAGAANFPELLERRLMRFGRAPREHIFSKHLAGKCRRFQRKRLCPGGDFTICFRSGNLVVLNRES